MRYTLYNTDRKVLAFDFKDMYLEVLDDEFLPYALRGRICTSSCDTKADIKKTLHDIDAVKDFLSNRVLSFRRSNAKAILYHIFHKKSLQIIVPRLLYHVCPCQ